MSAAAAAAAVTATQLSHKLRDKLQATDVVVQDVSGGCGTSFDVAVVSAAFAGKTLIARHRMVHEALADEMPGIHALSIKRAWTPEQSQQQAAAAAAAPAAGGAPPQPKA